MIFYVFKHAGLWILLNSERYPFLNINFETFHTTLLLIGAHSVCWGGDLIEVGQYFFNLTYWLGFISILEVKVAFKPYDEDTVVATFSVKEQRIY